VALFKSNRRLGTTLLAAWLIASGILTLVPVAIPYIGQILAILAIAAGVLILLER
jgi:hypothetical protein